ncbi:MAG: hypothetical protein AB8I08_13575 [Sandaracinaceae bacterium]
MTGTRTPDVLGGGRNAPQRRDRAPLRCVPPRRCTASTRHAAPQRDPVALVDPRHDFRLGHLGIALGVLLFAFSPPASAQEAGPEAVQQALSRYRGEPDVDTLVSAALAARSADPSRVRDAMDRARAAGWLPTTRVAVRRGQTVDLRGIGGGTLDEITNVSTDDALTFEASMVFRFDRLAFAPEEPALLRELRAVETERDRVIDAMIRLYFERRRLQLERDLGGLPDAGRSVRILELEALMNALSGGAFSRP